jgi:hypothetical protein
VLCVSTAAPEQVPASREPNAAQRAAPLRLQHAHVCKEKCMFVVSIAPRMSTRHAGCTAQLRRPQALGRRTPDQGPRRQKRFSFHGCTVHYIWGTTCRVRAIGCAASCGGWLRAVRGASCRKVAGLPCRPRLRPSGLPRVRQAAPASECGGNSRATGLFSSP